jgi:ABC-2 type transport system permease protein
MNWRGMYTLWVKEVWRFLKVTVQTVLTPVVTALLYLMIFTHLLEQRVEVYPGVSYGAFLIPGLVMMSVIQNAFANSSSSLIQSKMVGNLVFLLLAPISPMEFYLAFVAAAVLRGVLVGLGVYLVSLFFVELPLTQPLIVLLFAVLGSGVLGALGLVAGVWSDKFEQLAAFQNFVILPLSFLSGVFYSIHSLPGIWQEISRFNPFFYMIDGFRYGFLGVSDVSPWLSAGVTGAFLVLVSAFSLAMLHTGYKLRY